MGGEAFDTKFGGKVTFEEVAYRQMMNLAEASLKIYDYANTNWQKNALNYYYGVMTLQALVEPYINTEAYQKEVSEVILEGRRKYMLLKKNESKDLIKYGRHQYVNLTVSVGSKILKIIMLRLADEALLIPRAIQASAKTDESNISVIMDDGEIIPESEATAPMREEGK
jgi:hypothetical protein